MGEENILSVRHFEDICEIGKIFINPHIWFWFNLASENKDFFYVIIVYIYRKSWYQLYRKWSYHALIDLP